MAQRVPMTKTGYNKLQEELRELEAKVPPLKKAIRTAREHGDLSENAEYHSAREALVSLEDKMRQLQAKLASAELIDHSRLPDDVATIGSTVTLMDMDSKEEEEYILVGAGEDDFLQGRILTTSPLGQALLRRKKGDEFRFNTPNGMAINYKVLAVKRC